MVKDAKDMTMIKISKELTKKLKDYKVHPRESYEEVIVRALEGELYSEPEKDGFDFDDEKGGKNGHTRNDKKSR